VRHTENRILKQAVWWCAILVLLGGCQKNDNSVNSKDIYPPPRVAGFNSYFPLIVGRSWTYIVTSTSVSGNSNQTSTDTEVATVSQANKTIDELSNAFDVEIGKPRSTSTTGLAFFTETQKLWMDLNTGIIWNPPPVISNLQWRQNSTLSFDLATNDTLTYYIRGPSNCVVAGNQHPEIASAVIQAGAQLLITTGNALGSTSLVLKNQATLTDSMTVVVYVDKVLQAIGPTASPWFPVWALTNSQGELTLFSWDSTMTFKQVNDSTLVDRLRYIITCRYVAAENITSGNTKYTTAHYQVRGSIYETIYEEGVLEFDGTSVDVNYGLWLSDSIGIIKGEMSGISVIRDLNYSNLKSFIQGLVDTSGALLGAFKSPRVNYYTSAGGSFWVIINKQPADTISTLTYLLLQKSF
jgi:hypothetical protein